MRARFLVCISILGMVSACGRYVEFETVKAAARARTASPAPEVTSAPAQTPGPASASTPAAPPVSSGEKPPGPITSQSLPPPAGAGSAPVAAMAPQLSVVAGGKTVVARSETLFAISRRTGVDVTDLISANSLQPPYGVREGQTLVIPPLRYHRVEQGETANSIARRYDVTLLDIVRINNLAEPYGVVIGQRVKLPSETESLLALAPPLRLPAPTPSAPVSKPPMPLPPTAAPPATTAPLPKPPVIASTPPATSTVPAVPPMTAPAPPPLPAPSATAEAPRFIWPVRGRIVAGFGDLGNGRFNDGVNLAATRGEPVKVAADGVVLFAQPMRGFGNLVLVRHPGNWLTAYAHNDALLVTRGTQVKRGEIIARAGQSGTISSPQLHFEVRRGSKPVNPVQYLPSRDGV